MISAKYRIYAILLVMTAVVLLFLVNKPLIGQPSIRLISSKECIKAKQDMLALDWFLPNNSPPQLPCTIYEPLATRISFPYKHPSESKATRFIIEADLYYTRLWPGTFSIAPEGKIDSIAINGVALLPSYDPKHKPQHYFHDHIDLSPYLSFGTNKISIHATGNDKNYGLNITGHRPIGLIVGLHTVILTLIGGILYQALLRHLTIKSALHRFYDRLKDIIQKVPADYWIVAGIPVACIAILSIAYGHSTPDFNNTSIKIFPPAVELAPMLIAFFVWFHAFRKENTAPLAIHPNAWLVTLAGIEIAFDLLWHTWGDWQTLATIVGMTASFFIWIDIKTAWQFMLQNMRFTIVAVIASVPVLLYVLLYKAGGIKLSSLSAKAVYAVLYPTGMTMVMEDHGDNTIIASNYFGLKVFWGCSGLEGIMLFFFLLSVMLLVDWELFKNRRVLPLYIVGFTYMFYFNTLRIASLFVLGYWAYKPNSWQWVQALKGAPVYMFHSYVGWVYYFIAFALFTWWLYRPVRNSTRLQQATGGGYRR